VIRIWNRQAEILFGWRKEEVADQKKIDIFLSKKDRELHHTEINNFIQTGHGSIFNQHFEMDAVHRNGHEIQVDIVIWPFQIDGQWRFNGLLHGIGEKKKLEQQMIQAQKMETVGQLAGGIAHDFNNLLTVINGYTGMRLSMTAPDDPAKADLEEIAKAGERATSLVQQLLVFSRKQVSQMKVINLNNLAQDMGKMLKRLTPESVTLIMVETPDLWSVNIDPSSFHQVITNLVVNASHAMPKGGKIAIETKNIVLGLDYVKTHQDVKPGEYVVLEVSDTGTGMTEEVKTHIFEPFFTTKEKGKGTGLGLSTVFGIVKQSNGSIEVYSEIGHGTTFKIYLPRAHEEAQAWYPSESKESLPRGNETILVVEDEESVRNFSVRILRDLGYKVLEASNGQEAQHLAEGYRPNPIHLLITDMVMPQMGGKELSEKFKSLYPKSRIIFTSGYTENIQIHSGDLRQEEAFLPKPFSQKAIAYKIREVLDR
jgi:PAS domain S-box-containing protein